MSRKPGPRLRSATWKLVHRFRELVSSGADLFRAKPIYQRSSSVVEMPMVYIFFEPFCKQKPSAGILPFGTDSASAQRAADSSRAKPNFLKKSTEKESPFGSPFSKEKPAKTIFREQLKISSKTTGKPTPKSPLRAPGRAVPLWKRGHGGFKFRCRGLDFVRPPLRQKEKVSSQKCEGKSFKFPNQRSSSVVEMPNVYTFFLNHSASKNQAQIKKIA